MNQLTRNVETPPQSHHPENQEIRELISKMKAIGDHRDESSDPESPLLNPTRLVALCKTMVLFFGGMSLAYHINEADLV